MPGLLDIQNNKRQMALGQFNYLNGLDAQRTANNDQLNASAEAQQKQGIGAGVGTLAVSAATGNPVGMVMGGVQILGSVF